MAWWLQNFTKKGDIAYSLSRRWLDELAYHEDYGEGPDELCDCAICVEERESDES